MRKLFYFLIALFFSTLLSAQIPNPNFENWNTTNIDNIATWTVQGKVTKATSAQDGTFAAKLETTLQGFSPTAAILALTSTFTNGYPYNQKTDTIKIIIPLYFCIFRICCDKKSLQNTL